MKRALVAVVGVAFLGVAASCEGCRDYGVDEPGTDGVEVRFTTLCLRDSECRGDELCNCANSDCTLCRSVTECFTHLENTCVSKSVRLDMWMPVFVDGGWILETSDAGGTYASWGDAYSAGVAERERRAGY